MKKAIVVHEKPVYDMEALFACLLIVGQQRDVDSKMIFQHELNPVPPSLIDEFGCLRTGDKSCLPDVVLIDGTQLLYHIVWPVPGTGRVYDIVEGIREKAKKLEPQAKEKFIIFDRFEKGSAKEHECQRRAGEGSREFNLELNTMIHG